MGTILLVSHSAQQVSTSFSPCVGFQLWMLEFHLLPDRFKEISEKDVSPVGAKHWADNPCK